MRLAIDTSELSFMVATTAEKEGDGAYRFKVLATDGADGEVITVQVPEDPKLQPGQPVRLQGLTCRASVMLEAQSVAKPGAQGA